jgi:hypothetical protein
MRILFFAAGMALLGSLASPSVAADLTLPRQKEAMMPTKAPAQLVCLRWIPETYSWYNYCDRVPNYGPHENHWFGPF